MPNFFTGHPDRLAHFAHLDLEVATSVLEHGYTDPEGPGSYDEATDMYRSALELVGDIAGNYIAERSAAIDLEGARFEDGAVTYAKGSLDAYRRLGDAGFAGVIVPRRYGGLNFPATIYIMMIEMVSQADASMMTMFGYQDIGEAIAHFGTDEVAAAYLPKYASGEHIAAMVMTEPGAGSDLAAIRLKAHQDDEGGWRLRGVKHFISNGNGDLLLVLARSEEGVDGMLGLSLFACHGGDRVIVNRMEEKMGLHGSPTCELFFDDAPAALVGKRRQGLIHVLHILNHARFSVAAQALGIAQAAYDEALAWASEREQFGRRIIDMPAVANMLVDMRARLEVSRAMLYDGTAWLDRRNTLEEKIAGLRAAGEKPDPELKADFKEAAAITDLLSPAVKYHITEAANRVCYDAQQIHGGMGYMREMAVERLVRDVRITTIYEGTSQVQIGASVDHVLADVLATTVLSDHVDGPWRDPISAIRADFDAMADVVRGEADEATKDAAAKDLVDTYVLLYGAQLMARRAMSDPTHTELTTRLISQYTAAAAAARVRIELGVHSKPVRHLLP